MIDWERLTHWPRDWQWLRDAFTWVFAGEHSADWWSVVLTLILAVAAIVAGYYAFHQVRIADLTRRGAMRPLIFLDGVALLPPDVSDLTVLADRRYVEVTMSNHGPGPAVDISVIARVFPCPRDIHRSPTKWDEFLSGCLQRAGTIPPLRLNIESIGPHSTTPACLLSDLSALVPFDVPDVDTAVVFFSAEYRDVFGTRFEYPTAATPGKQGFIHRNALLQERRPPAPEGVISLTPPPPAP